MLPPLGLSRCFPQILTSLSALVVLSCTAGLAYAHQAAPPQEVHQHGLSQLDVVLQNHTLLLALQGPAHNFVGFEHTAQTPAEREQLAQAQARLRDGNSLFQYPVQAGCVLQDAKIDAELTDEHQHPHEPEHDRHHTPAPEHGHDRSQHHAHISEHGHDHGHPHAHASEPGHDRDQHPSPASEHGHDHHHAHTSEHGHSHSHHTQASEHGQAHSHADWRADYTYTCAAPSQLSAITVTLFDHFPLTAELRYQRASDSGQSGGVLRPGNAQLGMR